RTPAYSAASAPEAYPLERGRSSPRCKQWECSMISYRENLAKIGISLDSSVSYRDFFSAPQSLRQAILSMDAPGSHDWHQVSDIFRDESWTDEVQGVAYDGEHWIFSTNANQKKPGCKDKAIYVFQAGSKIKDGQWISSLAYKNVPHP